MWLPINKNLWTSSYVLFTGGFAARVLAVCYWLCDSRRSRTDDALTEPFVALGRNAILLLCCRGCWRRP
jgi:predicted acyltransferase